MDNLVDYKFAESYLRDVEVTPEDIKNIVDLLELMEPLLDALPTQKRNETLRTMQGFLIDKLSDYYQPSPNNQSFRLRFEYDPIASTWQTVHEVLSLAQKSDKHGAVAQYLVGAKLQLRFPSMNVENELFSTADIQKGRAGDFLLGNTAFHVTVRPMLGHYEKCQRNLDKGLRVYLLVPDTLVEGTKQNAELHATGRSAYSPSNRL